MVNYGEKKNVLCAGEYLGRAGRAEGEVEEEDIEIGVCVPHGTAGNSLMDYYDHFFPSLQRSGGTQKHLLKT